MATRRRLDQELVKRKIARSREHAQDMIRGGRVTVAGLKAHKPATQVTPDVSIKVEDNESDHWASRGAHKLLSALATFEPEGFTLADKKVIDAGASTGGFTDVCLNRGAASVAAVDVGYGQLAWKLQNDPKVTVVDRTNIRHLTMEQIGGAADVVVGDLSFISLTLVLPALVQCVRPGADLLPMVKPQFEVGKDRVGAGGVVRSPELRREAIDKVIDLAETLGLSLRGVVASGLPGPSGNVEYFLWLVNDGGALRPSPEQRQSMVAQAIEKGPQ